MSIGTRDDTRPLDDRVLVCARCGERREKHLAVNHADGAYVTETVLLCQTSVYLSAAGGKAEKKNAEPGVSDA